MKRKIKNALFTSIASTFLLLPLPGSLCRLSAQEPQIAADFEYRLYEGTLLGTPTLKQLMSLASSILTDKKFNTTGSLKQQFETQLSPEQLNLLAQAGLDVDSFDNSLRLPRIESKWVEWNNKPLGIGPGYRLRFRLDGDWQITFPQNTLDAWPESPAVLDAKADEIKFRINLQRFSLLNFGVRVEYYNGFVKDWRLLETISVLGGSKLEGIHGKVALRLSFEQQSYELVPTSGEKFRPVTLALASTDLSHDKTDIDFGTIVHDWLLDALNYIADKLFGKSIYDAIAEMILESLEEDIPAQLPFDIPPLLDFPLEAAYGKAFNRPADEQISILYYPVIDIVAGVNETRAIHFRHGRDAQDPADPTDLFDPDRFNPLVDRIKDYININEILVDFFDVVLPIPDFNYDVFTVANINALVNQFGEPRFRERDMSALHLLRDGVPPHVIGGLTWSKVDLRNRLVQGSSWGRPLNFKISEHSVRALTNLSRSQPHLSGKARNGQASEPVVASTAIFATPQGWHLGERGLVSLWKSYAVLDDLLDRMGDLWHRSYRETPPLPDTMPELKDGDNPGALGYAVNSVVPNIQFAFFHAAGGFVLSKSNFSAGDFVEHYPFPESTQMFTLSLENPAQTPFVNFFTNTVPSLRVNGLPVELVLNGDAEQPLQATLQLNAGLNPRFLQCEACLQGKEETFLALLNNLACLAQLGMIEITGNTAEILQCLLHRFAIALVADAEVSIASVVVESPGTFPAASAEELQALLEAALPHLLAEMIPVPVMFDLFHAVPHNVRDAEKETLAASGGWMTYIQPLYIPE